MITPRFASIGRIAATAAASTAATALLALSASAQASTLAADGSWAGFSVDANLPPYSSGWIDDNAAPLSFDFSIAAGFVGKLTVVDAGFSGDVYQVKDGAAVLGHTSVAVDGDPAGALEFSFDNALASPQFSHGVFTLGAGTHHISGSATRFLSDSNGPLNATFGAVRLDVSPVPEPAMLATLLAGLSLLTVVLRRRNSK